MVESDVVQRALPVVDREAGEFVVYRVDDVLPQGLPALRQLRGVELAGPVLAAVPRQVDIVDRAADSQ